MRVNADSLDDTPTSIELSSPMSANVTERSSRRSTFYDFHQDAIRQSNMFLHKKYQADEDPDSLHVNVNRDESTEDDDEEATEAPIIKIDGTQLQIADRPLVNGNFAPAKRWLGSERHKLTKDVLEQFRKSATGWILAKDNKLQTINVKHDDAKILVYVKNLHNQLKMIRQHCYTHDTNAVFTIVLPVSLQQTSKIRPQTFDLFRDYTNLHPTMIANSNAWYNTWVHSKSVRENLSLTFEMLQNNTEPGLWSKAFEDHEEFAPIQQGGPLVLYFILKRIMDVSEASIQYLQKRIKHLKLTDLNGENVDEAVSLIKSTVYALKQCSTDVRNYVPDDLRETVLKVFQTSSNPDFNEQFKCEEREARHKADKYGGIAKYPSISETCSLATNAYKRYTGPGEEYSWVQPTKTGSAFLNSMTFANNGQVKKWCFNCGDEDHTSNECRKEKDLDEQARQKAKHQRMYPDYWKRFNKNKKPKTQSNRSNHSNNNRPAANVAELSERLSKAQAEVSHLQSQAALLTQSSSSASTSTNNNNNSTSKKKKNKSKKTKKKQAAANVASSSPSNENAGSTSNQSTSETQSPTFSADVAAIDRIKSGTVHP